MRFLQTYYTSCAVGETGSSGFQFYSSSDGITNDELQEIRELGSYEAPFGLPVSPTEDETLHVFPVAFKYFRLKSGRVGILQSTACTMEYTGRPGNFFTHALLLEEGEFPIRPVLFHGSDFFQHDLTSTQKSIKTIPPKLPVLTVEPSDILSKASKYCSKNFAADFLKQGKNKKLISKLLDLILSGKNQEKNIILAGDKIEDIIYVLSAALPATALRDLTFSTYARQPEGQNVVLSGTCSEGSAFEFENEWMQRAYYVFNKTKEQYPEIENQGVFPEIAVELLASQPEKLAGLYQFSDNFNVEKTMANLDIIAGIYTQQSFNSRWKQELNFVAGNAKNEYIDTFLSDFKPLIDELTKKLSSSDDLYELLKSLYNVTNRSSSPSSYFEWLFSLYMEAIRIALKFPCRELMDFNRKTISIFAKSDKALFGKLFFGTDILSDLYHNIDDDDMTLKSFTLIVGTCKELYGSVSKVKTFFENRAIKNFISDSANVMERVSAENIQCFISEADDDLGMIILQFAESNSPDTAKRLIDEFYKTSPKADAIKNLEQKLLHAAQKDLYYFSLPYFYRMDKNNENFFFELIENEPEGSCFDQVNRFMENMFKENGDVPINKASLDKIMHRPEISDLTRRAVILGIEHQILSEKLTAKKLDKIRVMEDVTGNFFDDRDIKSLDLLFSAGKFIPEKKIGLLIEKMRTFPTEEKMKLHVFFEYYKEKIIEGVRTEDDWRKYYTLTTHISLDSLNDCSFEYLVNTPESTPVISFISIASQNKKKEYDKLVKKILVSLSRKKYNHLKDKIRRDSSDMKDYFNSINKNVRFKRLFNLKF